MSETFKSLLTILFCLPLLYIVFTWLIYGTTYTGTQIAVCIVLMLISM